MKNCGNNEKRDKKEEREDRVRKSSPKVASKKERLSEESKWSKKIIRSVVRKK